MTHCQFSLRFHKALQVSGYFLALAEGRMKCVKLLKLLYVADRQCLQEFSDTITGDRVTAMRKGHVLSTIHNLINAKNSQWELWYRYIKRDDQLVFIVEDPGTDDLYAYEKEVIERTFGKYGSKDENDIIDLTHTFNEWKNI